MKVQFSGITIECIKCDIASQPDINAVVNAANERLQTGGGVAGAIHRTAGPGLEEECRHLAPIKPGEAVITGGYNLPNKYVIHCLGPVFGYDKPEDRLLADCYRNALKLADQHKVNSIAFPAISTGIFGYPPESAAEVAIKTIKEVIPSLEYVRLIRLVFFSQHDLGICEEKLLNTIVP